MYLKLLVIKWGFDPSGAGKPAPVVHTHRKKQEIMKTFLPEQITTEQQAREFLSELASNNEDFHPEDDAHTILWNVSPAPTFDEREKLNKLMQDIYTNLPGFDPCEFLLNYHKS